MYFVDPKITPATDPLTITIIARSIGSDPKIRQKMKNIYKVFALVSALAVLVACQKQESIVALEGQRVFSASLAATKAVSNEGKMAFEAGDVIELWYNNGSNKVEVTLAATDITNSGHNATFTADIPADVDVLATYGASGACTNGVVTLDFEGAEYACTATCKAGESSFNFTNIASVFSFTLTNPDVKLIAFMGADPNTELFLLDVPVDFNTGLPTKTNRDGRDDMLMIECDGVGTYCAAVLPGLELSGFIILLCDAEGEPISIYSSESPVKVGDNEYLDFGDLPKSDPITFDIKVSDITANSAKVSIDMNDLNARFICDCLPTATVLKYKSDEALYNFDMEYFNELFEEYGEMYGYDDAKDFIYNMITNKGVGNMPFTDLNPNTSYTFYIYAVDKDLNIVSDGITRVSFTTLESKLEYIGQAKWHDIFVSAWYDVPATTLDLDVDVYEDPAAPGVFHFDTPYGCEALASWFNVQPSVLEDYEGIYWKTCDIVIDASDPSAVRFPWQNLYVSLNSEEDGWIYAGAEYGTSYVSTGTYSNGKISFAAKDCLTALELDTSGYLYSAGDETTPDFTITMPSTSTRAAAPAKKAAASAEPNDLRCIKHITPKAADGLSIKAEPKTRIFFQ